MRRGLVLVVEKLVLCSGEGCIGLTHRFDPTVKTTQRLKPSWSHGGGVREFFMRKQKTSTPDSGSLSDYNRFARPFQKRVLYSTLVVARSHPRTGLAAGVNGPPESSHHDQRIQLRVRGASFESPTQQVQQGR